MEDARLRNAILIAFVLVFALKVYYLDKMPFQFDETVYGEMIAEEANHITFLPTYLGYWAPWKPGLYFITYSLFLPITSQLFTSLEWIYRSPNLLFGLINAFLVYKIIRHFSSKEFALAAALLFYSSLFAFYVEARLLMEAFAFTPILLSILFYTDKNMNPPLRFGGAALFALVATLTKSILGFMVIPLAIAYVIQNDRKNLFNPLFLLSFLAPFLGMLIFYLSLQSAGMEGVLMGDTGKFFIFDYLKDAFSNFFYGFAYMFLPSAIYLVMAFRKLFESWRTELFFSAWFALALIPLFADYQLPWYFYYLAPAFSFFAVWATQFKGKFDNFSALLLALIVISNIVLTIAVSPVLFSPSFLGESRETGLLLSGKENVLFAGSYYTLSTVISYKILSEREEEGSYKDFGYLLINSQNESEILQYQPMLDSVVSDYRTDKYEFEEENFASLFWTNSSFRKKTNISEFDYIVVSPANFTISDPHYYLWKNGTAISIYKHS